MRSFALPLRVGRLAFMRERDWPADSTQLEWVDAEKLVSSSQDGTTGSGVSPQAHTRRSSTEGVLPFPRTALRSRMWASTVSP